MAGATAGPAQLPGGNTDAYRLARNVICAGYEGEVGPLRPSLAGLYDVGTAPAARAAGMTALTTIATKLEAMTQELIQLETPSSIAVDNGRAIARQEDMNSLIRQELDALARGDLAGAKTLDLATEPLDTAIGEFETHYGLVNCP